MKKALIYVALFGLFFINTASMCSDADDNISDNSQTIADIRNTVTTGSWRITYYFDTDHEETTNFNSFTFVFGSTGVLTASNTVDTFTGTWSVTDSGSNDDSSNDIDFNIAFSDPSNFAELSDDWEILTRTSTKIELIDMSGGNGGIDYLTFEKN